MMTDQAHIFNPADDSLKAKVSAWKKVAESYENLQKSKAKMSNKSWSNKLGSEQDISQASEVIQFSLQQAAASFKQAELKEAQHKKLLSNQEIQNIAITQRQAQMQSRTSNKQNDQSRSR